MNVIPELQNLANGSAAAGDQLAEKICLDAIGELVRLQGIVDKLPKCWRLNDAGELVQDVPVVPGMVLWYCSPAGVVETPMLDSWADIEGTLCEDGNIGPVPFCDSREAAEKRGEA